MRLRLPLPRPPKGPSERSWGLRRSAAGALLAALVLLLIHGVALAAPHRPAGPTVPVQWSAPLHGEVVRGFAPPAERWLAGHRGVDVAAGAGAVVRAAGAGRVGFAGLVGGRPVVMVLHGEVRTTYEPVRAEVSRGDLVARGQPIGVLTDGGHCEAVACLHWGLRRGEDYLDPLALLGLGAPPRLLPMTGPVVHGPGHGTGTTAGTSASGRPPQAAGPRAAEVTGARQTSAGPAPRGAGAVGGTARTGPVAAGVAAGTGAVISVGTAVLLRRRLSAWLV